MKKTLLPLLGIALAATLCARAGDDDDKPVVKKKATVPQVTVRWGADTTLPGAMTVAAFRKQITERLQIVNDSANRWKIRGFDFQYAERGMYEDSAGNPLMVVEYLSEFCPGDSVSSGIRGQLPPRVKAEDTAFISRIRIADSAGNVAATRSFQVTIVR